MSTFHSSSWIRSMLWNSGQSACNLCFLLQNMCGMLEETWLQWNRDRAQRMGASIAFYAVLSLAPLLVILVTLAALIWGSRAAEGRLAYEVGNLIGFEAANTLQAVVADAVRPGVGSAATLVSGISLIV